MREPEDLSVYIAGIEPLKDEAVYDKTLAAVSAERREKAGRYRAAQDRIRCIGAELLLKKALRDRNIVLPELRYGYGEYQKPFLPDAQGFRFSISHSGDYCMLAASGQEVGCDIEKVRDIGIKTAERFFAREEYEQIAAAPEAVRSDLFFRFWTLKESFLKVTGQGIHLPLDAFRIVIKADGSISVIQNVDENEYLFAESGAIPGYRMAVCSAGEFSSFSYEIIDLSELIQQEIRE